MAIKGQGYLKTTWAFEERPVASAKLNTWDDRIEAALELVHLMVYYTFGGRDGIIRGAEGSLAVTPSNPPSLSVNVDTGFALIGGYVYRLAAATQTPDFVAPASDPRIDLIQARLDAWDIHAKTGTEAATPEAPGPDANALPLAHVYLRPGMTSVKADDDGTNAYLTGVRPFV